MEAKMNRVLFAAPSSSSGKTTVVCSLLQLLVNKKIPVAAFKCGPDYIDPLFHSRVIGAPCRNLDLFFTDENMVNYLLYKNAQNSALAVLEGVMGYYDGLGGNTLTASAYHLAKATKTPVVLVVNARGMSLSIAAQVKGFLEYQPQSQIKAVLLNQVSSMVYPRLKAVIEEQLELPVVGYLPHNPEFALKSRHLGLVTAAEISNLKETLEKMAAQAEKTIDLSKIMDLAAQAPPLAFTPPALPQKGEPVRLGVAMDKAFCFYYQDTLSLLGELGAQLVPFSPLEDKALPLNLDGVYIGGGYPELYARELSANSSFRRQLAQAISQGMPCFGECGGFMYLHQQLTGQDGAEYPMVGAVEGTSFPTGRLQRFGYASLTAGEDTLLLPKGGCAPVHEFHYWDTTCPGASCQSQKHGQGKSWPCMVSQGRLFAGYPHFYFYSNPAMAQRFLNHCRNYKKEREQQ